MPSPLRGMNLPAIRSLVSMSTACPPLPESCGRIETDCLTLRPVLRVGGAGSGQSRGSRREIDDEAVVEAVSSGSGRGQSRRSRREPGATPSTRASDDPQQHPPSSSCPVAVTTTRMRMHHLQGKPNDSCWHPAFQASVAQTIRLQRGRLNESRYHLGCWKV